MGEPPAGAQEKRGGSESPELAPPTPVTRDGEGCAEEDVPQMGLISEQRENVDLLLAAGLRSSAEEYRERGKELRSISVTRNVCGDSIQADIEMRSIYSTKRAECDRACFSA